jgi:UPF0716 family protein affecting phage T7 exclusion
MKNWFKKQATELTAWVGFFICASVFFVPDFVTFFIGVLLIAIDDTKASEWVKKISPKFAAWLDGLK